MPRPPAQGTITQRVISAPLAPWDSWEKQLSQSRPPQSLPQEVGLTAAHPSIQRGTQIWERSLSPQLAILAHPPGHRNPCSSSGLLLCCAVFSGGPDGRGQAPPALLYLGLLPPGHLAHPGDAECSVTL